VHHAARIAPSLCAAPVISQEVKVAWRAGRHIADPGAGVGNQDPLASPRQRRRSRLLASATPQVSPREQRPAQADPEHRIAIKIETDIGRQLSCRAAARRTIAHEPCRESSAAGADGDREQGVSQFAQYAQRIRSRHTRCAPARHSKMNEASRQRRAPIEPLARRAPARSISVPVAAPRLFVFDAAQLFGPIQRAYMMSARRFKCCNRSKPASVTRRAKRERAGKPGDSKAEQLYKPSRPVPVGSVRSRRSRAGSVGHDSLRPDSRKAGRSAQSEGAGNRCGYSGRRAQARAASTFEVDTIDPLDIRRRAAPAESSVQGTPSPHRLCRGK